MDHVNNIEILWRVREEKVVLNTVKELKLEYFGYVMSNEEKYSAGGDQDVVVARG